MFLFIRNTCKWRVCVCTWMTIWQGVVYKRLKNFIKNLSQGSSGVFKNRVRGLHEVLIHWTGQGITAHVNRLPGRFDAMKSETPRLAIVLNQSYRELLRMQVPRPDIDQ